mgnify:CR=1 FL=1|tara:strand:- start:379 stop:636 length:258 start_codon:yes stop_codon:yes gene_type:complete
MLSHVLNAEVYNNVLKVPRHLFATLEDKNLAYFDLALSLICNQIISQPCIVALMTQIEKLGKNEALGPKIIPGVRFVPMTGGVPK